MERIYTIPLREVKKAPRSKRAPKAMRFIEKFLKKNMKSEVILIDGKVNEKVWERGIKNIPPRIKVKAEKLEDESVLVTLAEE